MGWLILSLIAGIVAGGLVEYLLGQILPQQPRRAHIFAIVIATVVFALVAVWTGNTPLFPPPIPTEPVVATQPEIVEENSGKPFRVLVDTYHGQPFVEKIGTLDTWSLQNKGFEFEELTTPLTTEVLSKYDVYVIWLARYEDQQQKFKVNEFTAIQDYLENGGSAFLIGLGWVWENYYSSDEYPLDVIASEFGIKFERSSINTVNEKHYNDGPITFNRETMREHSITTGISQIAAAKSAPGPLNVSPPAEPLIWTTNTNLGTGQEPIILAASSIQDGGKLVALQHVNYIKPFDGSVYENQNFPTYDNLELLENILTWLAQ